MKKRWQEKPKYRPSVPKVLRLEKGSACYSAVREIRLAWRLSVYTRTLSYLFKR